MLTATGQAALREMLDVPKWFNVPVRSEVLDKRYFGETSPQPSKQVYFIKRHLRHRELQQLAQGHTASERQILVLAAKTVRAPKGR